MVTASDSYSQRRSEGKSATADSTSTQPPASNICRRRLSVSASLSGGGASNRGPRSASVSTPCARVSASARRKTDSSTPSPRMRASDASCRSVRDKGDTPAGRPSSEIGGLAFQCPGFGRRLLRRFFHLRWEIGGEPLDYAALQRHGAITLTDETGGDARARELVRIRIVDDDLAVARKRRGRRVRRQANRAGQLHGAVFVWILQPGVDEGDGRAAVESLLQIFLRDA